MRIVITGASRGIGFQIARSLAMEGPHKVLALSRNEAALRKLSEEVLSEVPQGDLHFKAFDLTEPDWPGLDKALQGLGGVDVLINNAGLLIKGPFATLDDMAWQRSLAVNLLGPVSMIRHLLPHLQASDKAHILNIGSMGGFQGSSKFPGLSAYSVSKGALANLTECLAEEFRETGIAVNCLALGAVNTEMLAEAFPGLDAPVNSPEMGAWIGRFALTAQQFFNGKVLPVSVSTP